MKVYYVPQGACQVHSYNRGRADIENTNLVYYVPVLIMKTRFLCIAKSIAHLVKNYKLLSPPVLYN